MTQIHTTYEIMNDSFDDKHISGSLTIQQGICVHIFLVISLSVYLHCEFPPGASYCIIFITAVFNVNLSESLTERSRFTGLKPQHLSQCIKHRSCKRTAVGGQAHTKNSILLFVLFVHSRVRDRTVFIFYLTSNLRTEGFVRKLCIT